MNIFSEAPEIFLHTQFVDFRKSINGLVAIVEADLARDAYTGTLFVFCNKAKDKLKILYWDKAGFALWYKRLEKQKFKWPTKLSSQEFKLTQQQMSWLLSGYDVLGHEPLHYQSMI
jgi:transposase